MIGHYFLVSEASLKDSPSSRDGVDAESEQKEIFFGCSLIQEAGYLLRLAQVAMCSGQVLLHRFYSRQSLKKFPVENTAMACVFVAGKLEEMPRDSRSVISVFHRLAQRRKRVPYTYLSPFDTEFTSRKTALVEMEGQILKILGFYTEIVHPHKYILNYLALINKRDIDKGHSRMAQLAWNFANDSLRLPLCISFAPEVIACAAISYAANRTGFRFPSEPAWHELFDVSRDDMLRAVGAVELMYGRLRDAAPSVAGGGGGGAGETADAVAEGGQKGAAGEKADAAESSVAAGAERLWETQGTQRVTAHVKATEEKGSDSLPPRSQRDDSRKRHRRDGRTGRSRSRSRSPKRRRSPDRHRRRDRDRDRDRDRRSRDRDRDRRHRSRSPPQGRSHHGRERGSPRRR